MEKLNLKKETPSQLENKKPELKIVGGTDMNQEDLVTKKHEDEIVSKKKGDELKAKIKGMPSINTKDAFSAGQAGIAMAEGQREMQEAAAKNKFENQRVNNIEFLKSSGFKQEDLEGLDKFELEERIRKIQKEAEGKDQKLKEPKKKSFGNIIRGIFGGGE